MMELLVVKCGKDYLRFTDSTFTFCQMSKASVYPLSAVADVRSRMAALRKEGIDCRLMKLIISEEVFAVDKEE